MHKSFDAINLNANISTAPNKSKAYLYPKFYWKHMPPLSRNTMCSVDSF